MENKNKNNEKKIIRNETQSVACKPTSYEQKYIKSKKIWGTILGVVAFILLIVGATYAWYTWIRNADVGTKTGIFDVQYNNDTGSGASLQGTLSPTEDKTGGLSTWVNISKTSTSVSGNATLKLHITELTMGGTCSITAHETQTACESASGTWTAANPNKFHFAVYTGGSCSNTTYDTPTSCEAANETWTPTELVGTEGTLEGAVSGGDIILMSGIPLTETSTRYYIYVWLDANAEDEYSGSKVTGYISASATQS